MSSRITCLVSHDHEQLQILNTMETGRDIISELPTEVLLNVMSYLPADDIAVLQALNRTLQATVQSSESYICRPRIERQVLRLSNEVHYADLTGVPFNDALRRFVKIFFQSEDAEYWKMSSRMRSECISGAFANTYQDQNRGVFTNRSHL